MTKTQQLQIVGKEKKVWETKDGMIMPFFSLKEGTYVWKTIIEENQDGKKHTYNFLQKVFKNPKGRQEILMYKELIDQLKSGGTILVDEDVLKLV